MISNLEHNKDKGKKTKQREPKQNKTKQDEKKDKKKKRFGKIYHFLSFKKSFYILSPTLRPFPHLLQKIKPHARGWSPRPTHQKKQKKRAKKEYFLLFFPKNTFFFFFYIIVVREDNKGFLFSSFLLFFFSSFLLFFFSYFLLFFSSFLFPSLPPLPFITSLSFCSRRKMR